jgi:hypothetical protein
METGVIEGLFCISFRKFTKRRGGGIQYVNGFLIFIIIRSYFNFEATGCFNQFKSWGSFPSGLKTRVQNKQ